jgi:hypothetical protein
MMKTNINTQQLKELLAVSGRQIRPDTLDSLRMARTHALNRQRVRHTMPVLAWLGHHSGKYDSSYLSKPMNWVVAVLFVACLITGTALWNNYTTEHEISEIDIAILTDDMPIHVYVDR